MFLLNFYELRQTFKTLPCSSLSCHFHVSVFFIFLFFSDVKASAGMSRCCALIGQFSSMSEVKPALFVSCVSLVSLCEGLCAFERTFVWFWVSSPRVHFLLIKSRPSPGPVLKERLVESNQVWSGSPRSLGEFRPSANGRVLQGNF